MAQQRKHVVIQDQGKPTKHATVNLQMKLSLPSLSLSLNETPKIIQTHDVYIDGGYIYIYIGEDTAWPNKRNSLNLRSVHMQCFPIAAEMSTKTLGIPKLPSDA